MHLQHTARNWSWIFAGVLLGVTAAGVIAIVVLSRDLPSPSLLESIQPAAGTTVYDRNGRVFHEFFTENRILVGLDQISPKLVDAIIATEDRDFRAHWGVDVFAIGRATLRNLLAGHVVEGASTITQQLARSLFLTQEVTLTRKIKEALLALRIEQTYSKDRILELYLNQIYFGDGAYGVETTAQNLFEKHASELNLAEAALLAGLPQNPSGYSPRRHPERARQRRSVVLSMMVGNGAITREEAARADTASLSVVPREGGAPLGAYFLEYVRRDVIAKYGAEALYSSGLRIYTTLDADLEATAEQELEKRLKTLETEAHYKTKRGDAYDREASEFIPYVQGAVLAMDVSTGEILAMVGGRDFEESPFNRATQAPRQPGSAFKPFVYTAAIDRGKTPADTIIDAPIVIPGAGAKDEQAGERSDWIPENFSKEFQGKVSLRYALKRSINIPAVKLAIEIGPDVVARYARQMGITTPLSAVYSIALGSEEVRLVDIVRAYNVLADQGIRVEPFGIVRIEDRNGRVLETHGPKRNEVLSPQTAYVVTNMLESVLESGTGWAARAWGLEHPAAGKTGTTNDCTDAWFIGYSPRIICGVWVGFDDRRSLGAEMTGARVALPVWTEIMKSALEHLPKEPFRMPPGVEMREICAASGELATGDCPEVVEEVFVQGTEPTRPCHIHGKTVRD